MKYVITSLPWRIWTVCLYCLLCVGAGKGVAQSKITGTLYNEKSEPLGEVHIRVGQSDYYKTLRNGSLQVFPKVTKQKYEAIDIDVIGYRVKRVEGNSHLNIYVTPATQIRGSVVDKLKRNKKFKVRLQDKNEDEETTTQPNGSFVLNHVSRELLANPNINLKFSVDDIQVDTEHIKFEDNGTRVLLFVPNTAKVEEDFDIYFEEGKVQTDEKKPQEEKNLPEKSTFVDEFNKITENLLDDRQEQQKRAKRLKNEVKNLATKLRDFKNLPAKEREELIKYMMLLEDTFNDNDSLFSIYQSESKAEIAKMQRIIQEKDSLKTVAENKTAQVEKEKERIEAEKRYNELQFQTRIFIFSIILGVLLLLVFVFYYYNRIFKKQRDQLQIIGNELAEKVEEINQQKEEILTQRDDLEKKSKQLEYAYGQMTASIVSAERIQKAILDSPNEVLDKFADGFVLYYPRDIVSGDFYWCLQKEDITTLSVIDCTGHGVPGAFMTMLGNSLLNYIVNDQGITQPNTVLTLLDKQVQQALHQNTKEENYVGMDMAFLCLDYKNKQVRFAGAKHYVLHASKGDLVEIKGAKFPIGITKFKADYHFEEQTLPLVSGDCFYLQSDGFEDQIAEMEGRRKKLTKKRYIECITQHCQKPFAVQKQKLEQLFEDWRNENAQTDDITVVGVKIK
jgi:serine phosphatase RsbU (regulator of sigma subunit)